MGPYVFSMAIGTMMALFGAMALPPDTDTQALEETEIWRYMEAFPIILYLLIIISLLSIVRTDGPKFYIAKNDNENALKAIHNIY